MVGIHVRKKIIMNYVTKPLKQMMTRLHAKSLWLLFALCTGLESAKSQETFSLEDCYSLAKTHYPLSKQQDLITKAADFNIANISKGINPQLTLNGQATYQSEVTSIAVNIPGLNFEAPSKDQYKVYADIVQPITELFTIKNQKEIALQNADVQKQSNEVELYKLQDRINQLYFGILFLDQQLVLNQLVDNDLTTGKIKIEAAIKNGVDYKSSLDKIKAEEIKNKQRAIELKSQRLSYLEMLGFFIDKNLDENTRLSMPLPQKETEAINRPELKVFEKRNGLYRLQEKVIKDKNIPHLSLFLQGGAGKPSPLNMISNSFKPYYLGGIRANWSIINLYTKRNEISLVQIDRQMNDIQKELFLFNVQLNTKQQHNEILKLKELILSDNELVNLRSSVKQTSNVQLENGIISTSDYVREVNAEDQARQTKLVHEIQLLLAQFTLQNTLGN